MNGIADPVITLLGVLTVIAQILIPILLIVWFINRNKKKKPDYFILLRQNALTFAFIVASVATLGSLYLSEVADFVPCKLCWWQRIFMYPAAIILLVSLFRSDRKVIWYVLPLMVIGGAISIYHNVMQWFPEALECSEEVAKCSTIQFAEFGYITIPVMALTAFISISVLCLLSRE